MSFIEQIVDAVTGMNPFGENPISEVVSQVAGGFGLGGFGNVEEIMKLIVDSTGLDILTITQQLGGLDTNLLGNLGLLATNKIAELPNKDEVLSSMASQIGELSPDMKQNVTGIIEKFDLSKFQIDPSMINKVLGR